MQARYVREGAESTGRRPRSRARRGGLGPFPGGRPSGQRHSNLQPPAMTRLSLRDGIPEAFRDSVVALGNFDGFHLGHQAVVGRAVARAAHEGRPALVATFDPHPVRFFKPDAAPFRLTSLDQREELFAHAGADACLVFDFDAALAATSAEDFVAMLRKDVGAAAVVTGEDFTFGARRGGNAAAPPPPLKPKAVRAERSRSTPAPAPFDFAQGERLVVCETAIGR